MNFTGFLTQLEPHLDVPYPERRELLDELSDHLDAMRADFVAAGASAEQAYQRAIDAMALDEEFVASISDVHRPLIARALAKLPKRVSLGIEYGLIGLTGLFLMLTTIFQEAAMIEFMLNGGFFMVPINIAGLAVISIGIERIYSLFIKKDHSAANLDKRILSLGFLALVCTLTGLLATALGFFQAFSVHDKLPDPFPIFDVASIALTTTIWGMTLSLLAVTVRFVVQAKVARIKEWRLSTATSGETA